MTIIGGVNYGDGQGYQPQQQQQQMQSLWDKINSMNTQMNTYRDALNNQTATLGDDGLMRVEGGINRYGEVRPDTVLMRDEAGNLDERFLQTMSPEYLALQQKGMAEGDTRSAELAREMQGVTDAQQRDMMNAQAASALTGGMQNLAMRGGAGIGSRERLNTGVNRQLMAGGQGLSRDSRMANLAISQQDEAMKNQLLGQTGQVGQAIQEGNIGRLQQDIRDQNIAAHNIYGEDMKALGAQKSADAQAASAGGGGGGLSVICTAMYKRGLISEDQYKKNTAYGVKLRTEKPDHYYGYLEVARPLVNLMNTNKLAEKVMIKIFRKWALYMAGEKTVHGKIVYKLTWPIFRYALPVKRILKSFKNKESKPCHC